jgi:zeaxanthin glucosyltransferase
MTALFLMAPAYGHLNRSFPVARQLQADGYTIVYGHFGAHELAQQIKQQEFGLHQMQTVPFGVGFDESLHQGKRESYLETLLDCLTKRTFHARTADLTNTLTNLKPALILVDTFLSTDFIILYPLLARSQTKVVILQNMLSTYNDGLTPPLNSALVPGIASAKAIRKAWQTEHRKRKINLLKQQLTYAGYSRLGLIKWAFNRNKLPNAHRIRTDKVFHIGFDNVPEWIAAPRAFDFPERKLLPFQHHLNTLVDLDQVEDPAPAYQTAIERIDQERQTNPLIKLIYVSLGTAQEAEKKGAEERFFNKLIAVAQMQPNWRFILAVRPELVNTFTSSPTVFIFARVPQLHILKRADLFIRHGGLNSVLESILHHVPMLVYPLNTKWDLPGYAARVMAHGVGLMGDLVRDNDTKMTHQIEQLLTDELVKQNLAKISQSLLTEAPDLLMKDENFLQN